MVLNDRIMLYEVCWLICVVLLFTGNLASYVEQSPSTVSVTEGDLVTIKCMLKNTDYRSMYWYRQKPEQAIEALFYSARTGAVTNYTSEPYQAERASETQFSLELRDASPSHAAVYYCACSSTTFEDVSWSLQKPASNPSGVHFAFSTNRWGQTIVFTISTVVPDDASADMAVFAEATASSNSPVLQEHARAGSSQKPSRDFAMNRRDTTIRATKTKLGPATSR
ncbi:uncharacterized protein LOC125488007 [Rhincodon typus]|uniref:uncharacterized protein LOC125488007 n=1 Tax=Rhincodon typus TaxID=259920 RepID=UPI00202F11AF|nr:uncharacterized protein LOC125488007 [Rhincodon typus]